MSKTYHGWVVVEDPAPGYNPEVKVEYVAADGKRHTKAMGFGNGGCTEAINWWDKRLGKITKLEPTIRGCYRVFTEEQS